MKKGMSICPMLFVVQGLGGICIFFLLSMGGMDAIVNFGIKLMMRLKPGGFTWNLWKDIPIPVYLKFYVFNVSNAAEMALGATPVVQEMGPYTYLIDFDKTDFEFNDELDTVKFKDIRYFHFQPELSKGTELDRVTFLNIVFTAVSHLANELTDIDIILETLDDMLSSKGEKITKTATVRQLIWDGYPIKPYIDLANDPMVQSAGEGFSFPPKYADGYFALFKGKNGSDETTGEVYRGIKNATMLGQIYKFNEMSKLPYFKADSCNAINGSDGILYPPFVEPGITELEIFVPEVCRSFKWQYESEVDSFGINAARFRFPPIETVSENPDVWCFCHSDNLTNCQTHGILNLAPCLTVPLIFSKPHFYDVDPKILYTVEGLKPDKNKHDSYTDIYPITGAQTQANVRFQLALELTPYRGMPTFRNVSHSYIPFAWVDLSAQISGQPLMMLKVLYYFLVSWPYTRFLIPLGSIFFILIGAFLIYQHMQTGADDSDDDSVAPINPEIITSEKTEYGMDSTMKT